MKNIKLFSVSSFKLTESTNGSPIFFKMGDYVTAHIEVMMLPSPRGVKELNQFNKENGTTQNIQISSSLIYSYYDTSQKQRFYFTIKEYTSNSLDELLTDNKIFLIDSNFSFDSKKLPDFKTRNRENNLSCFIYVLNMNIENTLFDQILNIEVPIINREVISHNGK